MVSSGIKRSICIFLGIPLSQYVNIVGVSKFLIKPLLNTTNCYNTNSTKNNNSIQNFHSNNYRRYINIISRTPK